MSDLLGVTDIMTNVVVIHNEFTAFCLLSGAYLTWTQLWTGVILSQCLAQPLAYIFIVLDVKLEVFFYNQINSQGITPAIFSFDLFVSSSEFNFLPLTLTVVPVANHCQENVPLSLLDSHSTGGSTIFSLVSQLSNGNISYL